MLFRRRPRPERCVLCGRNTAYRTDTPISERLGFVVGVGQLCRECSAKMEGDEGMHEHKPAASLKREGKGQRPSKEQIIELVDDFALHMKHKMLANAHKGGWRGEQLSYVFTRLLQEVSELSEAIVQCQTPDEDGATEENVIRVAGEAADVANFAMMVYDLVKAEFEKRPLR